MLQQVKNILQRLTCACLPILSRSEGIVFSSRERLKFFRPYSSISLIKPFISLINLTS